MAGLATPPTPGAPGVYHDVPTPVTALTRVRLDVCAFAGVAPRGPARVPLVNEEWHDDVPRVEAARPLLRSVAAAVESWDEYRRLYGSFEGSGLLPYAVASFFEQGGRRAHVIRIVHDYGPEHRFDRPGVATGTLAGARSTASATVDLRARNEGTWGNSLEATLSFTTSPVRTTAAAGQELTLLMPDDPLAGGSLLRVTRQDRTRFLVSVGSIEDRLTDHGRTRIAHLDAALPPAPPLRIELVEGTIELDDGDRRFPRRERHEHLGLNFGHPRWAATVLCNESELVFPDTAWSLSDLLPADANLRPASAAGWSGGEDLSADIVPDDFFDESPPDDEIPSSGVQALRDVEEVAMLVAPDLYSPRPLPTSGPAAGPATLAGKDFERCVHPAPASPAQPPVPDLNGLRLDPELPNDLEKIIELQRRLVGLAEELSVVALLDVPPRLNLDRILAWRSSFDSSHAACYHPWLKVARTEDLEAAPGLPGRPPRAAVLPEFLVEVNPAAVAAGIIANREWRYGIPFGPANELTNWVIDVVQPVPSAVHDRLHQSAVNVYLKERDGVRLTAARTLSRDPGYRQLSVRRLMTMLARSLDREMQWAVFEPNNPALRAYLEVTIEAFLRRLFTAGAFKGATEAEAYFVRADDSLNTAWARDQGQLIVEVGVAAAEPLEFLVLRIMREGDGTLRVEGRSA